jgi:hypothetical protein
VDFSTHVLSDTCLFIPLNFIIFIGNDIYLYGQ